MPKQHKKGVGADLVGTPDELIKMMIKEVKDQKWMVKEIAHEGPPHKQVLSALLLKRLHKFVKAVEKSTGAAFQLQPGATVTSFTHDEDEVKVPVPIPVNLGSKAEKDQVVEAVSHAPLHELLAYTLCLQVIEWAITTSVAGTEN